MKWYWKTLIIVLAVYVGIVTLFESLLGYYQPASETTIVITTSDEDGNRNGRVLSLLESQGTFYVAANHWPRAWYHNALDRPEVKATIEGEEANYLAVPVSDEEHDRLMAGNPQSIVFKFLTGFPPRYFVRLDPRG